VERALYTHNNGHREEHLLQDAEDVKVRPLQGKAALIGRTRVWLRRAVDAVWPLSSSSSSSSSSLSTSSSSNVAALGGGGGGGGGNSPPKGYMHWRATTQDMLALSGSGGGGSGSGKMGTRYTASRPTAPYYHHYYHNPHAHQGLKVGPLLAMRQNVGDVGGSGDGGGSSNMNNMNNNNNNYNLSPQPYQPQQQHHKAPSALDKISINMTMATGASPSCPVELIAPCAVPSASLKDQGILREEGLIVPSSFLVGDVVDFVTRMSKLDRYSAASSSKNTTCRSLERIFVTDCGKLMVGVCGCVGVWVCVCLYVFFCLSL
jgi:hypothetical protein